MSISITWGLVSLESLDPNSEKIEEFYKADNCINDITDMFYDLIKNHQGACDLVWCHILIVMSFSLWCHILCDVTFSLWCHIVIVMSHTHWCHIVIVMSHCHCDVTFFVMSHCHCDVTLSLWCHILIVMSHSHCDVTFSLWCHVQYACYGNKYNRINNTM